MTQLAWAAILWGAFILAMRVPGLVAPARVRAWAVKFPRAVWPGRILLAIVAVWSGVVMFGAATEEWSWARPVVVIGTPVAYVLVILYGAQFLAIRGLAGLMLLVAKLLVTAADAGTTQWRLVVTVLAYLWVVAAIWMAAAPHHWRDIIGWAMASDGRCRAVSAVGAGVGVTLVALGLWVY